MEIMQFIHLIRGKACNATVKMIDTKYLSLKREDFDEFDLSYLDRKAFRRRLWRILRNNDVVRSCPMHQSQLTRASDKDRKYFVAFINEKMKIYKSAICNFDKTIVDYSFFYKSTLHVRGATTVSVRKAVGLQRCTVMIGLRGSNEKIPPLVVFKGKDTRGGVIKKLVDRHEEQQETTIDGVFEGFTLSKKYSVQERAWIGTAVMNNWI
jgi:hypothetical protein